MKYRKKVLSGTILIKKTTLNEWNTQKIHDLVISRILIQRNVKIQLSGSKHNKFYNGEPNLLDRQSLRSTISCL